MAPTPVPRLILASGSPRRLELLSQLGLSLEVSPADIDETPEPGEKPLAYATRLAKTKALRAAEKNGRSQPLLGADTIVIAHDESRAILGKPTGVDDARSMLTLLSGRCHRVVTAYCLLYGNADRARAIETEVEFRALSSEELDGYLRSGEWEGKAGAYAIQGIAAAFVRSVRGSYSNVVGLPLCEVIEDLRAIGALPADWLRREAS